MGGGADLVGRALLGKLRVVRLLGEGGMGTVYEVEHLLTRHRRALKVLRSEVAPDARVVARFVREAGVGGTVSSEHIVQTFDAGTLEDGSPFVLMELLEGVSLADRLRAERELSPSETAAIAIQICEGAAAAHDAGIVHRDLKPDNVFLTRDAGKRLVKILDFGISKFTRDAVPVTTDTGVVIGTPFYMSPEQARGTKDVDARADVYAVGVMLYEMLTGVRPYEEQAYAALVVKIHTGEHVPLAERAPSLDPRLAEVVERAMHVDPDRRFEGARALAEALRAFTGSPDLALAATMPSVPAPPRKRRPIRALGVALAVLAAGVTVALVQAAPDAPSSRTRAVPAPVAERSPDPPPPDPPPPAVADERDASVAAPPAPEERARPDRVRTERSRAERHGLSTRPPERDP